MYAVWALLLISLFIELKKKLCHDLSFLIFFLFFFFILRNESVLVVEFDRSLNFQLIICS